MRFKLRHLFIRYRKTETMLRAGKRNPKPAPCAVAFVRREEAQHVFRGISARKGAFVKFFHKLIVLQQFRAVLLSENYLFPARANGNIAYAAADFAFDVFNVFAGIFGKLVIGANL